ncbi:hypothetical protein CLV45_3738 [Hymenobacter chitinivorans DSM 11115]|uniref:Uncharacterized protein n=2 Tax=Hymenobacter chitinivorans TaxID=89969 RepID=A0A2M9B553_9BACT|nr:hypothetical protein CLV45_3738 [Hymenobacter chitinivorans DSM 11115]
MPNLASLTPEPGPEPEQPAPAQEAQPKRSRALAARPTTPSRQLTRPQLRPARQEAQGLRARQAARPRRAADNESDVLHVVLGSLLIIGGVILGLLIGGWLGLGVGAGVVILGYYFLVMGIGGSHAWREIFQEFFNL